jgi:hypothetical protein
VELLREEELKCHQRARVKNLLDWNVKTKYFQLVANREHKTRIFRLDHEQDLIHDDTKPKKYITAYYKTTRVIVWTIDRNNFGLDMS